MSLRSNLRRCRKTILWISSRNCHLIYTDTTFSRWVRIGQPTGGTVKSIDLLLLETSLKQVSRGMSVSALQFGQGVPTLGRDQDHA
jgi:hypothetical protein